MKEIRIHGYRWSWTLFIASTAAVLIIATSAAASTTYSVRSFAGQNYDGTSPADPNIAVGPTYIVETINTAMSVYTKSGTETSHTEFSDLFAPATNVFCADPRVIYWSWYDRYAIVCTDTTPANQTTRLAVSATADPNGSWHTWSTGPNTALDQPNVEATKDKLVVDGSTTISGVSSPVFWAYQSRMLSASRPRG